MKPSIDVYVESDAEFYRQLRPEAALLTRPPATLQEAADQATAVVIASVESVRVQRKIVDVYTAGVHLNVTKVLHGELSPELGTNVVVEFLVSSTEADVAKLGEFVPQAEAI